MIGQAEGTLIKLDMRVDENRASCSRVRLTFIVSSIALL